MARGGKKGAQGKGGKRSVLTRGRGEMRPNVPLVGPVGKKKTENSQALEGNRERERERRVGVTNRKAWRQVISQGHRGEGAMGEA